MRKRFSDNEDEVIRQNADCMTSTQIGKLLGRSGESIKCRARRIGVKLQKLGENHHNAVYSNDEIELVRLLADDGSLTIKQIAEKMEIGSDYTAQIVSFRARNQQESRGKNGKNYH